MPSLRFDPAQQFACSQCGRCCRGFDVVVSDAEIELYRRHNAAAWFRDSSGASGDPFEAIPGMPDRQRIRKRDDGACGFLSPANRCRIHEELGAAKKPLICRTFPYSFHPAPDATVVTTSFSCPTIVANEGAPIGNETAMKAIELLRQEWADAHPATSRARELVGGRAIDARSSRVLRENLLAILKRESDDIRDDIRRFAAVLDDLTRARVLSLGDAEFAEYLALTLPYAASRSDAPPKRSPGAIGRLMQYGFLYLACIIRDALEQPGRSSLQTRSRRLRMLAHFHHLGPRIGRVNIAALNTHPVDINASAIRPIVCHYLRSTLETLGASGRPLLDEIAYAGSTLNAACALAAMNAAAAGRLVDRRIFSDALMEASDLSHAASSPAIGWTLNRFSGGTEALWHLARQ